MTSQKSDTEKENVSEKAIAGNTEKRSFNHIKYPADLRKIDRKDLPAVCGWLREQIISNLCHNPGHFASSMGAVEITVALYYVFNTPYDRIVWDVGHQSYAHKILTGRREQFGTLRKLNGLSGFPNPAESEYDTFIAGHAANSISAALGMAIADSLTPGNENRKTVAVIGDASISCGLAFEGLNNVANNPNNLLIILNDNNMSIDNNVGALHTYLTELNTSSRYNRWRNKVYTFLKKKGYVNEKRRGMLLRFNNALKSLISAQQNIFEGLDIRYFGPFDGHDVDKIVRVLNDIKDMSGPKILHLRTIKGKGYPEAEKDPTTWHAPGKFDPTTGERIRKPQDGPLLWQEVFGRTLVELADSDERVTGITAAMPSGTSMNLMLHKYPSRAFDVGISEGHAVTFSGGLAASGKRPFTAIYSSFLQRAYDNIINDICIQGLPVTLCIDRAGIVGEDGVTHHGLFDLAYLRCIPGLRVAAPSDERTLRNLMYSSLQWNSPLAIRYPRGKAVSAEWQTPFELIEPGKSRMLLENKDAKVAILALGPLANDALKVGKSLDGQVDVADMIWLRPIDKEFLRKAGEKYSEIITLEDGTVNGGFGSAVAEWFAANKNAVKVTKLGVGDTFPSHGTVAELRGLCGYDLQGIERAALEALDRTGI